jgi:hypothetical protein
MLRRTERLLRQLLKEIDTYLDTLEAERGSLSHKETRRLNDLAIVERVTSKLNELALSIEFELHLKRTPGTTVESQGAVETEIEESYERTREQVERTTHLAKPKSISRTHSTLEARLDEWFGPMSDEPET